MRHAEVTKPPRKSGDNRDKAIRAGAASMVAARLTVVIIAVIGVIIARDPDSSIFTIVSFAWAGFGASFGPVMIFSLFWLIINVSDSPEVVNRSIFPVKDML
mgnify:CR=1 FL=1